MRKPGSSRRQSNRMPRSWCALSFVIAVAAATPNAAPQQAVAAGAARPNLKVLQALPEAQLFPLMNLLADSLGVRCEYCHVQATPDLTRTPANVGGWAWDRDDKHQKRTAREMMRMVVDLNAGRFQGAARVTCFTCHRGSTQPARTPPLPPRADAATTPASIALPSADRVWTAYTNAVGQQARTSPNTGTVISGWDDRSEGRFSKFEVTVAGPDRYRATVSTADGPTSQGLDGDVGWVATKDRIQPLQPNDVERLRRLAAWYRPVKERPANLQIVGVERLADGDVYVATARINATTTRTMCFDIVTGLLRRELTTIE